MAGAAGQELDSSAMALAEAIHADTGGNPYFVREVLWHLVESEALYMRDGRWTSDHIELATVGVPQGVYEVLERRLMSLDEPAEAALRTAAVIGDPCDIHRLAAVLDSDAELADVLDGPLRRGLIQAVPGSVRRFRFLHALVRQTLYEDLARE